MPDKRQKSLVDSIEISERLREIQKSERRLPPEQQSIHQIPVGSGDGYLVVPPDFPQFVRLIDAPLDAKGLLLYRRKDGTGWGVVERFTRCGKCLLPKECCVPNPASAFVAPSS